MEELEIYITKQANEKAANTLAQLIKKGYIKQDGKGRCLTDSGWKLARQKIMALHNEDSMLISFYIREIVEQRQPNCS